MEQKAISFAKQQEESKTKIYLYDDISKYG